MVTSSEENPSICRYNVQRKLNFYSIAIGVLLALSGGFMDAYSYIGRGGVFANAQTGNIVLLGIHLSQGNFAVCGVYAIPIAAFVGGIALAEVLRVFQKSFSWQCHALLVEIAAFIMVSTIDADYNAIANALISFVCGIQFESFRRVCSSSMTTTVCMGNIRTATQLFVEAAEHRSVQKLKESMLYGFITLCFVMGAVGGYFSVVKWGLSSILVCAFLLLVALSFLMLSKKTESVI